MAKNSLAATLCCALAVFLGCSNELVLPNVDSIEAIYLSLNDPQQMSYWNYEGFVDETKFYEDARQILQADQELE